MPTIIVQGRQKKQHGSIKDIKMNCTICGQKINRKNDASKILLGNETWERMQEYRKQQTICMDCKTDLLYAEIISPF